MSTATVIGLSSFLWALLSVLLALFVGRMIRLRERQRPHRNPSVELSAADRAAAASSRQWFRRDARDEF